MLPKGRSEREQLSVNTCAGNLKTNLQRDRKREKSKGSQLVCRVVQFMTATSDFNVSEHRMETYMEWRPFGSTRRLQEQRHRHEGHSRRRENGRVRCNTFSVVHSVKIWIQWPHGLEDLRRRFLYVWQPRYWSFEWFVWNPRVVFVGIRPKYDDSVQNNTRYSMHDGGADGPWHVAVVMPQVLWKNWTTSSTYGWKEWIQQKHQH